ncbi:MAG TPA: HlyD family efflux transporter periplasmic adaptor subunit [Roseiflexaceae bacterium]|nr:HlyD family efflux transporter periplasmic adaptor subunit [Roseiflexaceae bacterium]
MRRWMTTTMAAVGIALAGCASPSVNAPTPAPWTPPPTATREAATAMAPTATPPTTTTGQTFTVERGVVERTLRLNGQVVSAQEKAIWFAQDGVVQTVYVKPEETVKRGQLLADLSLGELADQLAQAQQAAKRDRQLMERSIEAQQLPVRRAEIDLEAARAALARVQAPPTAAELAKARADLQQAQANLAKTRNDASAAKNRAEQALKQAQRALADAQAEFGAASAAHERDKDNPQNQERLAKAHTALREAEDAVAEAQIAYDTALGNEVAAVQSAEANVAIAQAALDQLLAGPDKAAVAEAQRAVKLAELALEEARQKVVADPELQQRVEASEQAVKAVQEQIEARRLYAPFDGQVLGVHIAPGATVRAGETVLTLLDPTVQTDAPQLLAPATGVSGVTITAGMPVTISFSRYPGQSFAGSILQIPDGSLPAGGYLIGYEPKDLALQSGDQAVVTVTLERREDTLWLPVKAVRYDSDYFVMLLKDGVEVRVNVTVGLMNDERVEIVAGLNEGDVVVGEE